MPKLFLLLSEVIAMGIFGVAASNHFGLADGLKITAALAIAYIIPCIILERSRGTSTAARIVLFLLTAFFLYADSERLIYCSLRDGYSLAHPYLKGDPLNYYTWALNQYYGSEESTTIVFPGFSWLMVGLWKVFGVSMAWPLAMNMMFTLTSVVLTGLTTRRLLSHRVKTSPEGLVFGGMLLTCLLTFYLLIGTRMLKEGSIFISVSMAAFAMASMAGSDEERYHRWRDLLIFTLSCILLAMVRTTYMYFILFGLFLFTLSHPRRNWVQALIMLVVFVLSFALGNYFSSYSLGRHAEIVGGGWNMQRHYVIADSQEFYHDVLNYYFLYSPWHKLLLLPLTLSVQFILPFPWNPGHHHLLDTVSRLTYGWFFLGGTALFYYVYLAWKRRERLGIWAWWAGGCYAVIAYMMAGSVARYVLPIQPLFVPLAMYVLCRFREGKWRKAYLTWMILLGALVVIALLVYVEIQHGLISHLLHTKPLLHYLYKYL